MSHAEFLLDFIILASDVSTGCAFVSVIHRLQSTGSAEGLSLQTLIAAVSIRCLHLLSYHLELHYTPAVLPHSFFVTLDAANALAALGSLLLFLVNIRTYESKKDTFGAQVFDKFDCLPKRGPCQHRGIASAACFYAIVIVLSVLWHHVRWFAVHQTHASHSYYLSFYETLAALCLIPQLWMFHQDKRVPPLLANFVVFFALHKMLVLVFWAAFPIIKGTTPPNRTIQMIFDMLSLVILLDFLYYWAMSKLRGYADVVLDFEMIPLPEFSTECALG